MFLSVVYLMLNFILVLNLISFYNTFFLSVEILVFFLFMFICFNLFWFSYTICSVFFLQHKNLILNEYFYKFYDFYYYLDFYQFYIFLYIKNLLYILFLIKCFLGFFVVVSEEKLVVLKNFMLFLINNILFVLLIDGLLLIKINLNFYCLFLYCLYGFLKLYWNMVTDCGSKWVSNI